ncbi:MAG TPA: thiamine pyrophosphate-binding protein [Polyangiales bacterium]|jgi:acetolactate synthase-1/2/3 large subunit|nr:thiamine pyrophosphate-binding protein [Polyangiales bacterium]
MIVDDDELQLRAAWRAARRDPDLELIVASNPIDALLNIGALRPDVVVLDLFMPNLDGIEACRRIKENVDTRDVQVVLASAALDDDLAQAAHEAGAVLCVAKPIDLADVLALIAPVPAAEPEAVIPPSEPVAPQSRGADVLVQMLADAGVEVVFGLPGGAISPVHDALMDSSIRVITTRHESGAMFAACGFAHATGKLACVAVTSGPGALNAMTGLASAWCDGLPVLLLVGEVPRAAHGKGVLQDGSAHGLQIVEMARHVTKLAAEIPRASALPHLLRRAIATALSGKKGPVMLTLPLDVTTANVAVPRVGGTITMGQTVSPEVLDELVVLLRDAERPLILAGSGVRGNHAPARLRTVAEKLRCPVATTPKGKGVFPEDHALSLGVLGMGGHQSAREYLNSGVDVVVAIGTSLGDMATDGFARELQGSRALVHVDIDARQIGKSYEPTHAIVASAAELFGGLAERIDALGASRAHTIREVVGGVDRQILSSSAKPHRIASHDAIREIQATLPKDAIFTIDSGTHFLFAVQYLETVHADSFIVMTGLGSMGQSIGAAMGAQLANPTRTVAAICGDGCFAMNAFEIATAVAERLPLRIFVFNDGRLGMVEHGHATVYGRRPEYPTALDVVTVAKGLGATALRIDGQHQLAEARELLRVARGPVVVEVMIDHEVMMASKDRVAAMKPSDGQVVMSPKPEPRRLQLVN